MITKEELQTKIDDLLNIIYDLKAKEQDLRLQALELKAKVNNIDEQPEQYGRWKPKKGEEYYYITEYVGLENITSKNDYQDKFLYSIGNCFKTQEQAEQALERLKIRTQLEDIALRLNKGQKIDWEDRYLRKYSLYYNHFMDEVEKVAIYEPQLAGAIYCLDENFKDVAIDEIGEERLKKYLKGE